MKRTFKCKCGRILTVEPPNFVKCNNCGRVYIYKMRSKHYILAKE